MRTPSVVRRRNSFHIGLSAFALTWLGVAGCFHTADPSMLRCKTQAGCPNGYVCTPTGTCSRDGGVGGDDRDGSLGVGGDAGGGTGTDASRNSNEGGSTGGGRDGGSAGTDGQAGSTGNTDSSRGGGAGGVGGSTDGSASGGAAGGDVSGGSGGISSPDAPSATGGTTSSDALGATGGTTSRDAPGATGGTTSVPDAPIAPDGTDAPAGSASGTLCTADERCSSAHCIDGVCCATTCTGCRACSNAMTGKDDGTCAPVVSGKDPHETCADETATNRCGNDGTCDGNGACHKAGTGQKCGEASCSADGNTFTPEPKCDGNGTCVSGTPLGCAPYQCAATGCLTTCTTQAGCGTNRYCDTTAGTCATKKSNGAPATQTYECASGIIADGVCCDRACPGCSACTAALNGQAATTTGQCLAVVANNPAPHGACAASATAPCGTDGTCDGNGGCHYPLVGASCATSSCDSTTSMLTKSTCDSTHTCQQQPPSACPGSMACASSSACKNGPCSPDADCASGNYCALGTCTGKVDDTEVCSANNQCKNGNCLSGHCCHTACGECNSCSTGTCVALANNPVTACSTGYCSSGSCVGKLTSGSCISGLQCSSGNCDHNLCCPSTGTTTGCGTQCVNLSNDDNNCGSCGNVCQAGATCQGSSGCVCNASAPHVTVSGGQSACTGQNVTILANATLGSSAGFNYQWYGTGVGALSNGADYGNVTTAALQVKTANFAAGQYDYFCVVTDKGCAGSTTSGTSSLYISQSPMLTGIDDTNCILGPSECLPFSTTATGGAGGYQFMWYKDGVAYDQGNHTYNPNALEFFSDCSFGGQWYCEVTDAAGCPAHTNTARLRFACGDGVHFCDSSTPCP